LPIRLKVTIAFAGAMAIVLAVIGILLYKSFAVRLDEALEDGLAARAADVTALVQQRDTRLTDPVHTALVEAGESFAQILDPRGTVLDAVHPRLRDRSLLTPEQIRRAGSQTIYFARANPLEPREPARVLASPLFARGQRLIVVVGVAADDREQALSSLTLILAVGGPIALLLASLAGYGVAAAALRPVEAMRRKALEITEHAPGERLPVAKTNDEIARLGCTLNDMLARLERAIERERAFVSDASHELRTPLAILKTEIELALRGDRGGEELRAALESAAEETDRLAELAEALLVIARADGGNLPLATAEVQTAQLLAGVGVRFASRVRASGRELVVDDVNGARLVGDPRRLEQALGNLVEDALHHGAGRIRLSATSDGEHVELHVRDEGGGFPEEFIGEAFQRFTRADPARSRGGSGLGLSIVQVIAHAHGGEAHAANHPDGGADVCIELPAGGGATATDARDTAAADAVEGSPC
jgi:signal transduction histidine kinase